MCVSRWDGVYREQVPSIFRERCRVGCLGFVEEVILVLFVVIHICHRLERGRDLVFPLRAGNCYRLHEGCSSTSL